MMAMFVDQLMTDKRNVTMHAKPFNVDQTHTVSSTVVALNVLVRKILMAIHTIFNEDVVHLLVLKMLIVLLMKVALFSHKITEIVKAFAKDFNAEPMPFVEEMVTNLTANVDLISSAILMTIELDVNHHSPLALMTKVVPITKHVNENKLV